MTPLVRRFIKTAIVFLMIGVSLGLYMLVRRELFGEWPAPYIVSAHTHMVFIGFVMFMILGVALWIFPKPARNDQRFRPVLIEVVYWLLLSGTLLRFVSELLRAYTDMPLLVWLVLLGGFAQVVSFLLYVWTMWTRIRSTTQHKTNRVDRESVGS